MLGRNVAKYRWARGTLFSFDHVADIVLALLSKESRNLRAGKWCNPSLSKSSPNLYKPLIIWLSVV